MLHSLSASSKTDFESPYIFFGELKSGLFHLSSDLSRVLGTDPSLPCRLEEVFDAQLADECDREVLRAHFEEFRRECASRDLFVRLRLERQVVWCRIRAKSYRSDAGDSTLFSGTVEFYTFARIFSELLGFSNFSKDEIEKLARLASAPASHTLVALRLTSNFRATDSFELFTARIIESLREKASPDVVIEQFDSDTILCSTPEMSFDVETRAQRLLDAVLREHRATDGVKPPLIFAEGAESGAEATVGLTTTARWSATLSGGGFALDPQTGTGDSCSLSSTVLRGATRARNFFFASRPSAVSARTGSCGFWKNRRSPCP